MKKFLIKYFSRKFILTLFCVSAATVLMFIHRISDPSYVQLILGILASYHVSDSYQSRNLTPNNSETNEKT